MIDSPTAAGAEQAAAEGGRGRKRRGGAAEPEPAAAGERRGGGRRRGAVQQQQQQQEEEVKREGAGDAEEVVMLDASSDEAPGTPTAAANGGAGAGAAAAAAEPGAAMLEFPAGTQECAACAGRLAEASKALKVRAGRLCLLGGERCAGAGSRLQGCAALEAPSTLLLIPTHPSLPHVPTPHEFFAAGPAGPAGGGAVRPVAAAQARAAVAGRRGAGAGRRLPPGAVRVHGPVARLHGAGGAPAVCLLCSVCVLHFCLVASGLRGPVARRQGAGAGPCMPSQQAARSLLRAVRGSGLPCCSLQPPGMQAAGWPCTQPSLPMRPAWRRRPASAPWDRPPRQIRWVGERVDGWSDWVAVQAWRAAWQVCRSTCELQCWQHRRLPCVLRPSSQIVQPPDLAECLAGLLCECHRGGEECKDEGGACGGAAGLRLGYPPPAVVSRRGRCEPASCQRGCCCLHRLHCSAARPAFARLAC